MKSKQQLKLMSKWLGAAVMGFALLGIPMLTSQTQAAGFDRSERHRERHFDDDDDDRHDSKRHKNSRLRNRRDWDDDDDDRRRFRRLRRNRHHTPWWFSAHGHNRRGRG